MIVAFEGADGSGKSSTLEVMKRVVSRSPHLVSNSFFTKEPFYDEYIELLKTATTVQEKALLFAADRHHQYADILSAINNTGVTIFTDRSYISNYAYQYYDYIEQQGFKDDINSLDFMKWLRSLQPTSAIVDVVVLFEAQASICVKRCAARSEPLTEMKVNTLNYIYGTIIKNLKCKCIYVRTDNGLTAEEICDSILKEIGQP